MDLRRWYEAIAAEFAMTVRTNPILSQLHPGRGMALSDLFDEGHEEALMDNMNERPSLCYNKSAVGNRISLQLIGLKSNQAALGAVVTLQQGNVKHDKEVHGGDGYISQSDLRLHFDLGKSDRAEKISFAGPAAQWRQSLILLRTSTPWCAKVPALTRARLGESVRCGSK
jgi:hypothetical protein